jgi:hypothetical protein
MVPAEFIPFFAAMAGVGATLFGLTFLAVSISAGGAGPPTALVLRQAQTASSYGALLNPLVISLLALVPGAEIGSATLILSGIGLVNTLIMSVFLIKERPIRRSEQLRTAVFIVGSLTVFGFELLYGIRLSRSPADVASLTSLTTWLVIIYIYGVARAWDLVGARQFHVQELVPLLTRGRREATPAAGASDPRGDTG